MATVSLRTVWINSAVDLSDWVALRAASKLTRTSASDVRFQRGASGRVRGIRMASAVSSWQLDCDGVTTAELAWLRAHEATLCCFRDPLGGKIYGMWAETPDSPLGFSGWSALSLAVTEVSHSEAV